MSSLSVIETISLALQRTRRILFEPFQLNKWLRLGYCTFLMGAAETLAFNNSSFNIRSDFDSNSDLDARIITEIPMPWIIVTLLTCCLSLIFYIGSVILPPLTIFRVTYPLAFLEQLNPEWQVFPPERQISR